MTESASARMLRVDQAGEYGATRIYAGQLAVLGDRSPISAEIQHMAEQEAAHRQKFDALLAARGSGPRRSSRSGTLPGLLWERLRR